MTRADPCAAIGSASAVETTRCAIVLAGGLGTRLAGLVADRPKALADIAGRPFLDWQLAYLAQQPVDRVVLATGHLGAMIAARYGSRFDRLALDYSQEPRPLGTGGAVRRALAFADGDAAFVLNGDTIAAVDLVRLAGAPGEVIVVAVRRVADVARFGAVRCEVGRIVAFAEKRGAGEGLVNAGVYWVARALFAGDAWPEAFSLETDVLERHAARLRPRAVEVDVPFVDIGTPEGYASAQRIVPGVLAGVRGGA